MRDIDCVGRVLLTPGTSFFARELGDGEQITRSCRLVKQADHFLQHAIDAK